MVQPKRSWQYWLSSIEKWSWTRMHSSRMRTAHAFDRIFQHALCQGEGVCSQGVCSRRGSAPGGCLLLGGGVCSQGALLLGGGLVSAPGGCLLWGVSGPRRCAPGGCLLLGGCLLRGVSTLVGIPACTDADPSLWTEWLTDNWHITFANYVCGR